MSEREAQIRRGYKRGRSRRFRRPPDLNRCTCAPLYAETEYAPSWTHAEWCPVSVRFE